ncbi:MAG: DUF2442 domain-containing protein [Spirochaetota bacterium]
MIPEILNIKDAMYLGDYRLRLSFDDDTVSELDFGPFLKASVHPDIGKWLEQGAFRSFRLEYGELVWGDYELCFPLADLYAGVIDHSPALRAAV